MQSYLDQELGNYRLIRLLDRGGFADVYLGEHMHLGTQAAIKVHHVHVEEADLERFEQEARTIAHLSHPHIVHVLDYGVQDKVPYLVMEYAPRGTLRDLHPAGTMVPLETIVQYVKQIAAALQYAHDQQLVHRDVKPENMLLDAQDRLLLSDFGIAIRAHTTRSLGTQDAIGTVAYMAPEQLRKKARPASDQYALATIVYEWLCGAPPFDGLPIQVALQHIAEPIPSLRAKRPDLPRGVEQVLQRALSKEPEQRFLNVQAFADALEQAARGVEFEELPAEPVPVVLVSEKPLREKTERVGEQRGSFQSSRRTLLKLGIGAGGVLALAVGSFQLANHLAQPVPLLSTKPAGVARKEPVSTPKVASTPIPETKPTVEPGTKFAMRGVAWSPDSKLYATGDVSGNIKVWQQAWAQQWQATVPKIWSLVWSPANSGQQRLAIASDDGKVRILDALSGQKLLTYQGHGGASVLSLAWSPEGHGIASGDISGQIQVWDPDSGSIKFTFTQAAPVTDLAWGGLYLVAAGAQPGQEFDVWDAGAVVIAFTFTNSYSQPGGALTATGWSANGTYLVMGDAKGNISLFSDTNCSCWTYTKSLHAHNGQINAISWAPDNKTFATAGDDGTVQTWKTIQTGQTGSMINESVQHQQTYTNPNHRNVLSVAWSPDGKYLLFEDDASNVRIWQA
jgi:eukaryotic-like serine/threonine-protein kinase